MKAIIHTTGFRTRFPPTTNSKPNEMLPAYNNPTIQYIIEEAIILINDGIIILTGRNKKSIENYFDKSYELEYRL